MASRSDDEASFDLAGFARALERHIRTLPDDMAAVAHSRRANLVTNVRRIRASLRQLDAVLDGLDPIRQPVGRIELFAPATIGRLIGRELESVARTPLADVEPFYGAGVYAIYYRGDHPAYRPLRDTNCPIYIGKGNPKTHTAATPREQGSGIFVRLRKHRDNIDVAADLRLADFDCRHLVTESGWQMTAEAFLITLYQPVWNKETKVCQGFGKHGDRARTELSKWDVVHAGRNWASAQRARRGYTCESVIADIEAHFMRLLRKDPEFWGSMLNPAWVVDAKHRING